MSRRNAGEDWAFRKRLSPRLHNNAEVHNANPLVDGRRFSSRLCKSCSNVVAVPSRKFRSPATFSPKFHNPVAASSPEHGVNVTRSPKLGESLTQTHSPPAANPNFQRRLSPRLHKHLACRNSSVPTGSNRDSSSMRRRLSPRLHQDQPPQVEGREDRPNHSALQRRLTSIIDNNAQNKKRTPKHSALQRRVSPRLHQKQTSKDSSPPRRVRPRLYNNAESEKQTPEESAPRRRVSPRLHCDAASEKQTPKESAPRRRVSPRLGMDAESAKQTPKESVPHPRVGPRLHIDAESEKQTPKVSAPHRRVSARLHGNGEKHLRQESALRRRVSPKFHGVGKIENQIPVSNGVANGKRSCSGSHTNSSFGNAKRSKHDWNSKPSPLNGSAPAASNGQPGQSNMGFKVLAKKPKMESLAPVIARGSIRARVKETLRIFNTYYLQFVQEEEERCRKSEVKRGKKREASKFKEKDAKQTSSRPDLKAVSKMKEKKEILYPDKIIGHVPGIEVGYQFFSRAEMVAIGFHSHWLNGIDYIGQSTTKMEGQRCYNFPIAVAIVMSGQYEDDLDNLEDIIYTGQGGHDLVGSKLQCADQVLLRGNLAMKNSMEQSIPVRVIRGHRNAKSYTGKLYTYDGLYKVVETWADKGQRGHLVYKYHLKRMQEQPQLTTNQVQFVRGCPSKAFSELPGLVCCDISNGQEPICIPVTNIHDDVTVDEGFTYIKTLEVSKSVTLPLTAAGCACKGNCTNPKTCACARLNGSDFPYVRRDGGRLVEPKDVVFECGANCNCGPRCLNRTSQRGMKYHLEVYRTPDKGWAVRSWDFIPSGAPVCEYIGLLRRSDEVDHISGNEYIFEIDCWHTMNEIEGRERRFGNLPVSATKALLMIDEKTLDSTPEFCIDAGSRGNVARFMNHSCEPNLFVQCILSTYHDVRFARVVFFAAENIPPLQELTYDYGFALDSVVGPDGEVKALPCVCGTADCRKRLY